MTRVLSSPLPVLLNRGYSMHFQILSFGTFDFAATEFVVDKLNAEINADVDGNGKEFSQNQSYQKKTQLPFHKDVICN